MIGHQLNLLMHPTYAILPHRSFRLPTDPLTLVNNTRPVLYVQSLHTEGSTGPIDAKDVHITKDEHFLLFQH